MYITIINKSQQTSFDDRADSGKHKSGGEKWKYSQNRRASGGAADQRRTHVDHPPDHRQQGRGRHHQDKRPQVARGHAAQQPDPSFRALEYARERTDDVIAVYLIDSRSFKGLNEDMARALREFMRQEASLVEKAVKEEYGAKFEVVEGS